MPQGLALPPLQQSILGQLQEQSSPAHDSVLDPWYTTLIRKAIRLSGVADPQAQMIMPAVSGFMENGVPNVGARRAATADSAAQLRELYINKGVGEAEADRLVAQALNHPRVLAHISNIGGTDVLPAENLAMIGDLTPTGFSDLATNHPDFNSSNNFTGKPLPTSLQDKFSVMGLFPENNSSELFSPQSKSGTLAHEMTHAAQQIGLGGNKFSPLYGLYNDIGGYSNNPFELSAETTALNTSTPLKYPPNSTLQQAIALTKKVSPSKDFQKLNGMSWTDLYNYSKANNLFP